MTHEELREKAARAILLSSGWSADEIDDPISGPSLIACALPTADAALAVVREALREPSEEMRGAAYRTDGRSRMAAAIWRAMLAASPLAKEPGA